MIMSNLWLNIKKGIHSLVILSVNVLVAIFNPVLTFCINDLRTRNISRIFEGITAGIILIYIFVLFTKNDLVKFILDCLLVSLQLVVILIILILMDSCGMFPSSIFASSAAGITLVYHIMEMIEYFAMNKHKKKIQVDKLEDQIDNAQ